MAILYDAQSFSPGVPKPIELHLTTSQLTYNSDQQYWNLTNGVFFSTKKCAFYFKKFNFVFVS